MFRYSVPDNVFSCRHNFGGIGDGRNPEGSLIKASNGLLYGTVTNAEVGGGAGVLFSYEPSTGNYSVLHTFGYAGSSQARLPRGRLLQAANGLLYGTTQWGGAYGKGTIFSYDIASDSYTELYGFGNTQTDDAIYPNGELIQATNGILYGTTRGDGIADHGSIFSYNIATATYTKLTDFTPLGCFHPQGGLLQGADGFLYGLARDNFAGGPGFQGELFRFDISNNQFTSLHVFGNSLNGTTITDGCYPSGSLIQATDGKLYGLTSVGGQHYSPAQGYYSGVLFSYDFTMPPAQRYQVLYHFGAAGDGAQPWGCLLQASDGALYCTTYYGGASGKGGLFKYDIGSATGTLLYSLSSSTGFNPKGNLIEDNSPVISGLESIAGSPVAIHIYPNPGTGTFNVNLSGWPEDYSLEVYNLLGEKVCTRVVTGMQCSIDLSNQPDGGYFMYVYNKHHRTGRKIFICR
ncbi:MAG TPA: choice-of-anchor tandem repeat GloVer-containing protein [Chitinophagales bacterium]|nr:choice-of-anchor tandem repeat GloVer-containing protein [Chitinophagales bacterium]